jgi:urease accessory protein UreH
MVYIPDPTTVYDGACLAQKQTIDLEAESSLVLVDWFTSGRVVFLK